MRKLGNNRGTAGLEFCLVGIPLIFVIVSVIGIAFAMFTLHTMQDAVEQTARYAVTHGQTCTSGTNSCSVTIGTLSAAVAKAAPGVISSSLSVTFTPNSGSANAVSCNPVTTCYSNSTVWPPSTNSDNVPGNDLVITADYTIPLPVAMFWPGSSSTVTMNGVKLRAYTRQRIVF